MTETLLSDKNPLLKEVRRAAARGELTSDGFAVAEGFHLLEEALGSRCEIRVVIAAEQFGHRSDARRGTEADAGGRRERSRFRRLGFDGISARRDRAGAPAALDARTSWCAEALWWWCSTACRTLATRARSCVPPKLSARPEWRF